MQVFLHGVQEFMHVCGFRCRLHADSEFRSYVYEDKPTLHVSYFILLSGVGTDRAHVGVIVEEANKE